jgi:hypothetical protein
MHSSVVRRQHRKWISEVSGWSGAKEHTFVGGLERDAAVAEQDPVLRVRAVGALVDVDVAHVLPVA